MKHKYYDLIVRKAADMTLPVECRYSPVDKWERWTREFLPAWDVRLEWRIPHKHQALIDQKAARPELIVEVETWDKRWVPLAFNCEWHENHNYRLVEPKPKTVEMYKWIVQELNTVECRVFTTTCFYSDAVFVNKDFNPRRYKIIQRADWTKIEVPA